MRNAVSELSYQGNWPRLFDCLEKCPHLSNAASSSTGYTLLHQAAWHGASPAVIGKLLSLGADPSSRTFAKSQTAQEIAGERFPQRGDLQFLLGSTRRTPAQLLRKFAATNRELFESYDGNRVLFDRLVTSLSADGEDNIGGDVELRLMFAIRAVAGEQFWQTGHVILGPANYHMQADRAFWSCRVIPAIVKMAVQAHVIPLDYTFAVISDLFYPQPEQWGLRGDLFLWMEMYQALCHVPIPEDDQSVENIIFGLFAALTGSPLTSARNIGVKRFARGGLSSGMLSSEFWANKFIPLIQQRAGWLRESWNGEIQAIYGSN